MYRNVMERLVEAKVDRLWKNHTGCTCARCREDVIALALNNLPPKYVVSDAGALFVKMTQLENINEVEITRQVAAAMKVVDESPHHDE
ncbi:late competence development ComFB family protein [Oscillospiraceae bacterium LTW-04]|nr:late competence development ComFB family protein [Oscillospiraceae bacterium MB24-C1]